MSCEVESDRVQALEYCQKSAYKKISVDIKDSLTSVAIEISNVNTDEKEIIKKDFKCVKDRELFKEPKLDNDYRLVFNRKKIIYKNNAFNVYYNEI
ncbi:7197_t:CDS:2 [Dentiscutata erythropus]|uniref:7197_t:CDS:1 n=1 Tax=Dentiscutata erythropus TaxID=1348616 RepID=A0A9N9FRW2_9GLOM|nr:7197_t:CDS:2 [Dentiscutata erythropus]